MKKIAVIIALLSVALSVNAAEIPETTKAVLAKIEKANESLSTISSPVTETRMMPNGKEFVSTGNFYFSSPNLLAIRYIDPAGDYLVINTTKLPRRRNRARHSSSP